MSIAVVGTDTGVGKTVVSGLILARHGRRHALAYWKPVATGGLRDRDLAFIESRLGDIAGALPEEYLFDPPVSPHLASRRAGIRIERKRILAAWRRHSSAAGRALVVEGAGGLLVPLNDRGYLMADLVFDLGVPAVLVARSGLGTINHTLLSLEALRARRIEIAGVVLDGPRNRDNREAIERFGKVRVIAEVEPLGGGPRPSRAALLSAARRFDQEGILEKRLGAGGSRGR